MGKMKEPTKLVTLDPQASMFLDLSSRVDDDRENDAADRLGKVAKGWGILYRWGKELKGLSEAYSAKKKLKEASSFAEWSHFILKRSLFL